MNTDRKLDVEDGCLIVPLELLRSYRARFGATQIGVATITLTFTSAHHRQICEVLASQQIVLPDVDPEKDRI